MALRDIFKFHESPESETTKPFLEHLEDLRWTILKRAITLVIAMIISFALFLLCVFVCYFWLLPKTILFFFRDTESLGWAPTWTVQQYYSFVTRFTIGFGLAFELPVVVLALVRFGLITYRFMALTRPYAVVLIFILATIITPTPDILTLVAMSLPICLLYESCIWIAWLMERRRSKSITT